MGLAKKVPLTDMPQMVALFNGMGGGAAAVISYLELSRGEVVSGLRLLAISGGLIGSISFRGSIGAFMKLQGLMKDRPITYPLQQPFHALLLLLTLVFGYFVLIQSVPSSSAILNIVTLFFVFPLLLGFFFTMPIGGADMPVIIALFNALTGFAHVRVAIRYHDGENLFHASLLSNGCAKSAAAGAWSLTG